LKQTAENQIDAIIAKGTGGSRFVLMDTSAWTGAFEARLPFRLPPSFLALIRRYRYPAFDCSGVRLFGNVNGTQHDDLAVATFADRVLADVTQRCGFVQIGRPATGSYDAICFDLRDRSKTGEAPLAHLDHEEILINGRIKIVGTVSESFLELLGKLPN
jgi:hypothetical protein